MTPHEFSAHLDVSRETLAKLIIYERLLKKWQKTINLISPADLDDIWHRHIYDSAQLADYLPDAKENALRWVDLGSGAGFPGIVMAIMGKGKINMHLCESDERKCGFLQQVARETETKITVYNQRIEASAPEIIEKLGVVDVISARALAPLREICALMHPFWGKTTYALLHKGQNWQSELKIAKQDWTFTAQDYISKTEERARILEIKTLKQR